MKRALLACCAAWLVFSAGFAHAYAGVNLSWEQCYGDKAISNRSFACDTNAGAQVIVGSFVAPAGVTQLSGMEIVIDVLIAEAVPDWWRFKASGSCRQSALSINFVPLNPESNCRDLWELQGVGGIGAYNVGYGGDPRRIRIVAAVARPAEYIGPLEEDVEYFAFNLVISNVRTTGLDACVGCSLGARLILNSIKLTQPVGVGDFKLSQPPQPGSSQINWQAGATDPIRNTTWGNVKALYR